MSLDHLPIELLRAIAEILDTRSLSHWSLIARRYHLTLTEVLCEITVRRDEADPGWPLSVVLAARSGSTSAFEKLLKRTKNINAPNIVIHKLPSGIYDVGWKKRKRKGSPGTTLLHVVCDLDNEEMTRLLLKKGANVSIIDGFGLKPLHMAAWSGATIAMGLLFNHGADINAWSINTPFTTNRITFTALHYAVQRGHVPAVKLLIKAGVDVNPVLDTGLTSMAPICLAMNGNSTEIIQCLIDSRSSDMVFLHLGLSAAIERGNASTAKLFIDAGAKCSIDQLHRATICNNIALLQVLLESNPDLSSQDNRRSSLLFSVRSCRAAQIILEKAPNLATVAGVAKDSGLSLLDELYETKAVKFLCNDLLEIVLLLVKHGLKTVVPSPRANVAILAAAERGHLPVVKAMLNEDSSLIHKTDNHGNTVLHYAGMVYERECISCIKYLVEFGCDINAVNDAGETVLHKLLDGVRYEDLDEMLFTDITRYFISSGVNISAVSEMKTALHVALRNDHPIAALLLIDAGIDISVADESGRTALHYAVSRGHVEVIEHLLRNGADPYARTKFGDTPFHLAAPRGQFKTIEPFIRYGTELNVPNRIGNNILHLAVGERCWSPAKEVCIDTETQMMACVFLGVTDVTVDEVRGDQSDENDTETGGPHLDLVRRVCKMGLVDPLLENNQGQTPLDFIKTIPRSRNWDALEKALQGAETRQEQSSVISTWANEQDSR
ncbi:hypothetical protein AJ80_02849 [Polytolypa hystricis UAMH7299]|uniref:F-box domain-containing protein n=1 Tax=Polytolypa hystricis (strain UAMH7299) TaxID=1447883 RepID=A0A2B7YP42_POLH7|nr:hypothetical protein AJ80_02849 [Polytolypa hystricis UAMH7299]